ncbi:restriction endonuclease subunit S [Gordonia amicalis]|uniref:restriction endonuclease subunit S n=1 Tax=Gordonia amicalis TaxID=89053 RepID=UPI0022A69712|nr:restriction endonuclease subunit S [Gordonia amicalis]MCZ0914935.1 restriction endonuclease subunit S [Gordonia amicalis]
MKTVALGELVDFYSGGTPPKSNAKFWQGNVPWFSAKDMKKPRLTDSADHIAEEVFSSTPLRKLPPGTVAIVVRGMILAHTVPISILDVAAAINQDLKALLPKRAVDTSFLAAMLRAQHGMILSQVGTAAHGTKKLESRVLENLRIPFPPLAEQRRIAAILDHAESLRTIRRQVLLQLEMLEQSIFHDMFGVSDFEIVRLKDAVKWSSGKFLPAKNQVRGPHPVYGGNGINGYHAEFMFHEPKLIVGRVGAYCGAVHVTEPFSWVTDNALVATLLRDDLTLEYLLPALTTANLNRYAGVSGQPSISGGKIGDVQLAVPPVALQEEFADRISAIKRQSMLVETALTADDELFASLQTRALCGEL